MTLASLIAGITPDGLRAVQRWCVENPDASDAAFTMQVRAVACSEAPGRLDLHPDYRLRDPSGHRH